MAEWKRAHPKTIGDQTQAMVLARLLQVYPNVLIPFGENARYDLVIDDGKKFLSVQCKTGRLKNGVITFATCSVTYHHPNNRGMLAYRQSYVGEINYSVSIAPKPMVSIWCPWMKSGREAVRYGLIRPGTTSRRRYAGPPNFNL